MSIIKISRKDLTNNLDLCEIFQNTAYFHLSSVKKIKWNSIDLVFLSLPNGEAQKLINKVYTKNKKLKFIDLSADFRIVNSKIVKYYIIRRVHSQILKYILSSSNPYELFLAKNSDVTM